MLFRGHLDEVGHWGAKDPATGSSKDEELPAPHLLWPADHRWFVATDVDSGFTWVGGSQGLTGAVIADPKLDAGHVHCAGLRPTWTMGAGSGSVPGTRSCSGR